VARLLTEPPRAPRIRSLGEGWALWDVRNVDAHVRALLDVALHDEGARLTGDLYDEALFHLTKLCWVLSGLEAGYERPGPDGEGLRHVHVLKLVLQGRDGFEAKELRHQFGRRENAQLALEGLRACNAPIVLAEIDRRRPRGAYDPARGLSFCTYSRRILTRRVVDWYRAEFGDSRYGNQRQKHEISLEALAAAWEQDDGPDGDGYLDRRSPGGRLDFIDDLHRHAYTDQREEALTRVAAFGC